MVRAQTVLVVCAGKARHVIEMALAGGLQQPKALSVIGFSSTGAQPVARQRYKAGEQGGKAAQTKIGELPWHGQIRQHRLSAYLAACPLRPSAASGYAPDQLALRVPTLK
jgi:hypothetical protein